MKMAARACASVMNVSKWVHRVFHAFEKVHDTLLVNTVPLQKVKRFLKGIGHVYRVPLQ